MNSIEPHMSGDLVEIYCAGTSLNPHVRTVQVRFVRKGGRWTVDRPDVIEALADGPSLKLRLRCADSSCGYDEKRSVADGAPAALALPEILDKLGAAGIGVSVRAFLALLDSWKRGSAR